MLLREAATLAAKELEWLTNWIERAGAPAPVVARAQSATSRAWEVQQGVIDTDETIAGAMVDLRSFPAHGERRRRITARDTDRKREQRARAAVSVA